MVCPMTNPAQAIGTPILCLLFAACSAAHPNRATPAQSTRATDLGPARAKTQPDQQTQAARALVDAEPQAWDQAARQFLDQDGPDAGTLLRAMRRDPAGPGMQIAVAILGKLGDARAVSVLEDLLRERSKLSSEAALALGRLPSPQSRGILRKEMLSASNSPLNRTCAAIALLDLGDVNTSLPFLHAILLAGTPYGLDSEKNYGLPDRSRWAHERYLTIEAIARHFDGETFGLDPDSSWPQLKAAADRLQIAIGEHR